MADSRSPFFCPCVRGAEGLLRTELRELGLRHLKGQRGGVGFYGPLKDGLRALLHTRIAERVLVELGRGPAADADALYDTALGLPWEEELRVPLTFAVRGTGGNEALHHTRFVAQKVKDAVVERIESKGHERPNIDTHNPELLIVVHINDDEATFYLDLAGHALFRRGWRQEQGDAPLKETLAASLLAYAGHQKEQPLLDPMCGAGTVVIEAALRRRGRPPAAGSKPSVLEWAGRGSEAQTLWRELAEEARDALVKGPLPTLIGRDHNAEVLEFAERNARRAGVLGEVRFEPGDARRLYEVPEDAMLVVNPPYGERLGGRRLQLEGFYREFGEAWRELPAGHPLVVMSGHPGFTRAFKSKPSARHTIWNGPLRCEFLRFGVESE